MDVLLIIGALLVVLGVAGSIIPALPGPGFGFLGLVLLYFGRPGSVSVFSLALFGVGMAALILLDYIAPLLGAQFSGATRKGLAGAIIGSIAGIVFFPPLGIFIGAFFGACVGELANGKDPVSAMKAGVGTLMGSIAIIILQTIYSLFLAVYFFIKLF